MKGISELLEGLLPYSQRHFTRIDRLVRSTFLLDYTLARMSVLDPDNDSLSTVEDPILPDNKTLSPTNPQNNIQEETVSSRKKRKSSKSKKGLEKKTKVLKTEAQLRFFFFPIIFGCNLFFKNLQSKDHIAILQHSVVHFAQLYYLFMFNLSPI